MTSKPSATAVVSHRKTRAPLAERSGLPQQMVEDRPQAAHRRRAVKHRSSTDRPKPAKSDAFAARSAATGQDSAKSGPLSAATGVKSRIDVALDTARISRKGRLYFPYASQRILLSRPIVRRIAVAVFLLNLLAVTWPVVTVFRSAEPLVFGLPVSMAWPIAWIVIGWVMLLVLDHFEERDGES